MQHREIFPSTMIQSIRAGEQSGTLEKVLEEMADFYEKEVEYTLKKLTSLLEPLLMLMIGVAVGAMVIMMIAPIYSIIGGLQEMIDQ
jgi:type IV pilus assembly protein PilC